MKYKTTSYRTTSSKTVKKGAKKLFAKRKLSDSPLSPTQQQQKTPNSVDDVLGVQNAIRKWTERDQRHGDQPYFCQNIVYLHLNDFFNNNKNSLKFMNEKKGQVGARRSNLFTKAFQNG